MMNVVPLGSVASVKSGFAFKSKDWKDSGVPVVKIANVKDGFVVLDGCSFVDQDVASDAAAFELESGDILISMTGYIGEVAKVRNEGRMLLNQRVGRFSIKKPSQLDRDFLFYCLRDPSLKAKFVAHAYGAAQPNISPSLIEQQEIPLPQLPIQRRIAGILSAYDELIEKSQRRIKILESMARAIYREWFVHFRFPGHESIPLAPSPLGEIPKGWEVRKVAEFADFTRGFEPGSDAYKKEPGIGLVKFLRVGDLSKRDSGLFIDDQLVHGRLLKPLDIAITLDGSVGEVRLGLEGAYSSGIRRIDVKDASRIGWVFAYQLLLSDASQATIQAHAKGTTIKHAGSAVAALEFVSPPATVVEKFESIAAPIVKQVLSFQVQVENLRRTRDLLLPLLLSGQIDVEAMSA
jgi:type I restriction enzyme S subunit